jgi:transposase
MKRKQRRETIRKIQSDDLSLEVVHRDAAGIDIGNESHYVAVPATRDSQPVRRFGCTTAELKAMAQWLEQCGIRTVAMQSTGVYWIPVYDILEAVGLEVYLVNAQQTKNLPGRKSDVQESQWLMKLHTYGLLRKSFRPSQQIRTMRTYWRQRNDLVQAAGRHIQRMQKALTQMNIQLANVLSDVSGTTGQAIINAILAGERDPHKLAEFRDPRVKASQQEIAQSLEGNWQEDLLFVLKQEQDSYEFCQKQMLFRMAGAARPIGVPHAALRDEVRGPRSGVLRGPTPRPTDQTAQVESCQAGISSCPSSCSLNLKPRSFWEP